MTQEQSHANILYIEDNFLNMEIVRRTLARMGYATIEAFDGVSGVKTAIEQKPDLVLVDMHLPDIEGVEVITRLRRDFSQEVPIIVLTADTLNETYRRCIDAGCNGYLTKPLSRRLLLKTIAQQLSLDMPAELIPYVSPSAVQPLSLSSD